MSRDEAALQLARAMVEPVSLVGTSEDALLKMQPDTVKLLAMKNFEQREDGSLTLKTSNIPGQLVANVDQDRVRLYWEVLGKKTEYVDLGVVNVNKLDVKSTYKRDLHFSSGRIALPAGVASNLARYDTAVLARMHDEIRVLVGEVDREALDKVRRDPVAEVKAAASGD